VKTAAKRVTRAEPEICFFFIFVLGFTFNFELSTVN